MIFKKMVESDPFFLCCFDVVEHSVQWVISFLENSGF